MSIWHRVQRHLWLSLGLVTMSMVGTAAANHYLIQKRYQSTALLMVVPGHHLSSLVEGTQFIQTFASMADSQSVLRLTQAALPSPTSQSSIQQNVAAAPVANTDLFSITATASRASSAATLANALAGSLTVAVGQVMGESVLAVAAPAIPSPQPTSPRMLKSEVLAALLSVMAALLIAVIRDTVDTAITSEEDIERWTDLSVLGVVPRWGGVRMLHHGGPDSRTPGKPMSELS